MLPEEARPPDAAAFIATAELLEQAAALPLAREPSLRVGFHSPMALALIINYLRAFDLHTATMAVSTPFKFVPPIPPCCAVQLRTGAAAVFTQVARALVAETSAAERPGQHRRPGRPAHCPFSDCATCALQLRL